MVKIALDAGHGMNTPGKRTPDGEREWSFNNKVLLACQARLNQYENVQILRLDDPTGKSDVSLITRTNKANQWKADVLVSIHHNANTAKWGSWGGVETFIYPTASKASKDIANIVHKDIVKAMGLRDRGVKTGNLHMVRESVMPAILTEGGFMDSTTDIVALRSDAKLRAQGEAIANGLAQYFKLKLKTGAPKPPANQLQPKPSVEAPSNPQNKGEEIMKTSSGTLKKAYQDYLQNAINKGHVEKKWLDAYNANKLSVADALHLDVIIKQRARK